MKEWKELLAGIIGLMVFIGVVFGVDALIQADERGEYRAEAIEVLERIRENAEYGSVDMSVSHVMDLVRRAKTTYAEIGTSEEELDGLVVKGFCAQIPRILSEIENDEVEPSWVTLNYIAFAIERSEDVGMEKSKTEAYRKQLRQIQDKWGIEDI